MSGTEDVYRTNDGNALFTFRFINQGNGTWRADIQRQPSYAGRANDLHTTHRLPSETALTGYQVCYAEPPRSFATARKHAEAWAEGSWAWIRKGTREYGF